MTGASTGDSREAVINIWSTVGMLLSRIASLGGYDSTAIRLTQFNSSLLTYLS